MAITATSPLLARTQAPASVPASLEAGLGMGATAANPFTPGHWTQSIILRTVLGVLLTVGLALGFRRIAEGVLILLEEPAGTFWGSLAGFIAEQASLAFALVVATLFAAAGRKQTILLGLLIGAIVGFGRLSMATPPADVPGLLFALAPTWHILAGVLGAILGGMIWHAPSADRRRNPSSLVGYETEQSIVQWVRRALVGMIFANVRWLRILVAAIVIVAALRFMADGVNYVIRLFDLRESVVRVGLQKGFLVLLLQAVTVFVASGIAGATQNHGPAHGFWTGVIAGVVNLLLHVFLPKEDVLPVNQILMEIGWVFCLSVVGGAFGALVMPPMIYLARKRRPALRT